MDAPQKMEIIVNDEVKGIETSSPQTEIHKQEQLGSGEEAAGPRSPASPSESEPKKSTKNEPSDDHKAFKAAINNGNLYKVRSMLDKHPEFVFDNIGLVQDPPLQYIIRNAQKKVGDVRLLMVRQLVEHECGPANTPATRKTARTTDIVQRTGSTGRPALHSACQRGHHEIAKYLLKKGANVNAVDKDGDTALLIAIVKLDDSMVDILLSHGANPNAVAGAGTSNNDGRTALHKAASRKGASKIVDKILRAKAYVDPLDYWQETPLHDAARSGQEDAVRMLVEMRAKVDAPSKKNWTPLHQAARNGRKGTVEELLKSGASPVSRTTDGETPESLASKKNHNDVVDLLHQVELLGQSYFGGNQKMSEPNDGQKPLCDHFTGMVWPRIGDSQKVHHLSVMEMLYGSLEKAPLLEQLGTRVQASWIHLPANNKVWVEDVFKLIHRTPETTATAYTDKNDNHKSKATTQGAKSPNMLSKILQFIAAQLNETSQVTHSRQPHFRSAKGRGEEDHMISIVLPIIDNDMQQPHFYTLKSDDKKNAVSNETEGGESTMKETEKSRRVKEYTTSEGRSLDGKEKIHVRNMETLEKVYPSTHFARTLDESFHEILDERDLNDRNGDQVLSRYLARFRVLWEDERPGKDTLAVKEVHGDHVGQGRCLGKDGVEECSNDETKNQEVKEDSSLQGDIHGRVDAGSISPGVTEKGKHAARTPSELENQREPTKTARESTLWGRHLPGVLTGRAAGKPDLSDSLAKGASTGRSPSEAEENHESLEDDDDKASTRDQDSEESEDEDDSQDKTPRQQILVVPQLWLWKVGDIIVTTFPDRWDSSNLQTLPQMILENVERHASIKQYGDNESLDMKVHELLSCIIQTALEFEPLFSVFDNQRSYHQAFAGEIAFVSGEAARSYHWYRESLGSTADSFAQGVQQETDHLVMVDDILSELAMIRRVEQDQKLVFTAISDNLFDHYQISIPAPTRTTKLDRQVEDASRVRDSIITLLDLRQKQASTENALQSGRQSDILFAQSKVLFTFTVATVIFAPLSWVSSLMALKINNFTPDAWSQAETFAASFVSIVATFLLCLLGWHMYNKYSSGPRDTAKTKPAREQKSIQPGIEKKDAGFVERLRDQSRHLFETQQRKRQQQNVK